MNTATQRTLGQRLKFCTLTGVDEGTPIDALLEMTRRHPFAEFAVLYNTALQGQGRFPSMKWISELAITAQSHPELNLALHVCGSSVLPLLNGEGHVSQVAKSFGRIRLNLHSSVFPLNQVSRFLDRCPNQTVITTHNYLNRDVSRSLAHRKNHAILLDAIINEAGAGHHWISQFAPGELAGIARPLCGFAGGLSPESLATQLSMFDQLVEDGDFWLEIGSKLRTENDTFDIALAQRCLDVVQFAITESNAMTAPLQALATEPRACGHAVKPEIKYKAPNERRGLRAAA